MKNRIGLIIIIIGTLHTLLGIIKFSKSFTEMISKGLINSASTIEDGLAFWFTFTGVLFILLGYLTNYLEQNGLTVPKPLGWILIASSIVGVIIFPISGFWIVFFPAILIVTNKK